MAIMGNDGGDRRNLSGAGALAGIRVLDLSRVLAGPWATQIMGDLGAEVIKIERPGSGDDTRAWGPPDFKEAGYSAYYASANRNKRSVTVDIGKPSGQQLIAALAQQSDVLVENYKVGSAARHGLDYATLSELNPRLIYCSITGFGQTGPYAPRAGYDAMIQGMGGLMSITGKPRAEPGGGPQKVGVAMVDLSTGLYAAIAVLAALVQRARTGRGQHIDLALLDVAVAMLAYQGMNYLATGTAPDRPGNAHPSIVPYQDFPTQDGWMMLAVGNDGQFAHFCNCVGHREWSADARFATNPQRVANRQLLVEMITALTRSRGTREWITVLEAAGVPCGPINDIAGVFEDPQVQARQLKVAISPGTAAAEGAPAAPAPAVLGIASPLRLSAAPVDYRLPPPALGAHTRAVLREVLSLNDAQIDALAQQGAI
jgi:crotonobetainyl-CoA:carnitine CoA-transferase CaiB-like acyl-CoA transferase